jgi:peroxiredoxin
MGVRMRRFSMLVVDGVVKTLNLEEGTGAEASGAAAMLTQV